MLTVLKDSLLSHFSILHLVRQNEWPAGTETFSIVNTCSYFPLVIFLLMDNIATHNHNTCRNRGSVPQTNVKELYHHGLVPVGWPICQSLSASAGKILGEEVDRQDQLIFCIVAQCVTKKAFPRFCVHLVGLSKYDYNAQIKRLPKGMARRPHGMCPTRC